MYMYILTHHSLFSRMGIQCLIYVMFVWSGLMGEFLSIFFLKIPVWLVCYTHGFHVHCTCSWKLPAGGNLLYNVHTCTGCIFHALLLTTNESTMPIQLHIPFKQIKLQSPLRNAHVHVHVHVHAHANAYRYMYIYTCTLYFIMKSCTVQTRYCSLLTPDIQNKYLEHVHMYNIHVHDN